MTPAAHKLVQEYYDAAFAVRKACTDVEVWDGADRLREAFLSLEAYITDLEATATNIRVALGP